MPILDRKLPLPKIAPKRIVSQEDDYKDQRALEVVIPYADNQMSLPSEGTTKKWQGPMVRFQEGQYYTDLNTLLFLAQGKKKQEFLKLPRDCKMLF